MSVCISFKCDIWIAISYFIYFNEKFWNNTAIEKHLKDYLKKLPEKSLQFVIDF